jgi:GDP-L-fucose synthase
MEYSGDNSLLRKEIPSLQFTPIESSVKELYDWYESNKNNVDYITLFGDGTPLRQFLHANDLAKIIKLVIDNDITESFNVATYENYSIKEIANIALKSCDSTNLKIKFDTTKPNGQYRKDVSIEKLKSLFPEYLPISLVDGIKDIYKTYDKIS